MYAVADPSGAESLTIGRLRLRSRSRSNEVHTMRSARIRMICIALRRSQTFADVGMNLSQTAQYSSVHAGYVSQISGSSVQCPQVIVPDQVTGQSAFSTIFTFSI
jgi:hypothetical protein